MTSMIDHHDGNDSGSGGTADGNNCANNSFSIRYHRDVMSDDDDDLGMYDDDEDDDLNDPIREDLLEEVFCADVADIGDAGDSHSSAPPPPSGTGTGTGGDGNNNAPLDPSSPSTRPPKRPWWFRSQTTKGDIGGSWKSKSTSKGSGGGGGGDNRNVDGNNDNDDDGGAGGGDRDRRGSSASACASSSSGPNRGGRRMEPRRSLERDDSPLLKFERRRRRLSPVVAGRTIQEPGQATERRRMSDRSQRYQHDEEEERRRRGSHRDGEDQDQEGGEGDETAAAAGGDAPTRGEGGTRRAVRRLSGIFSGGGGGGGLGGGDGGSYDPLTATAATPGTGTGGQDSAGSGEGEGEFSHVLRAAEEQRRRLEKESSGIMTASTVGLEGESSEGEGWRSPSGRRLRGSSWSSSSRHRGGGYVAAKLGMRRERMLVVTLMLVLALVGCMAFVSLHRGGEVRVDPPAEGPASPEEAETASSANGAGGGPTVDRAEDDATFPVVAPPTDPGNDHAMTEQDPISTMRERGPPPKALLSLLSSISGSASSLMGDPDSASHRAMQWLLYEDGEGGQRLSWDYRGSSEGGGLLGSDLRARIEQRFALAAVYFANVAAAGDGTLTLRGGWMTGAHECDWEGVGCGEFGSDPRAGGIRVVTELDLSRSGLRGPIPDELRALKRLEHLMLQENDLTGSIPSWINELESLDSLYLSNNMFSGKIPGELALLPNLEELWIEGNSLSGSAPQAMCQRVHILVADCLGARPRVECTCCSSCFP